MSKLKGNSAPSLKATKGKWIVTKTVNNAGTRDAEEVYDIYAESKDGRAFVAECGSTKYERCLANANLLAAGKDMYLALEAILRERGLRPTGKAMAIQALKKARGETK
jgi:hypothetical protein